MFTEMKDNIPSQKEIWLPFLKLLSSGEAKFIHVIADELAQEFSLSPEAQKKRYVHSGELIFFNVIRFARLRLAKAGLVQSPERGFVQLSQQGQDWLKENPQAESITNRDLTQLTPKKPASGKVEESDVEESDSTDDSNPFSDMDKAYNQIHAKLKFDLYQSIMNCEAFYFEKIVIDLLINLGYGGSKREAGQAFSRSKDEGVDGVINEDRLGLDKIYVQAKRWAQASVVGRPEIQKFVGALAGKRVKKGIFITTAHFSKDAISYAEKDAADYKVVLIDKAKLIDYMIESNTGVIEDNNYALPIKKIDHDYFVEED